MNEDATYKNAIAIPASADADYKAHLEQCQIEKAAAETLATMDRNRWYAVRLNVEDATQRLSHLRYFFDDTVTLVTLDVRRAEVRTMKNPDAFVWIVCSCGKECAVSSIRRDDGIITDSINDAGSVVYCPFCGRYVIDVMREVVSAT